MGLTSYNNKILGWAGKIIKFPVFSVIISWTLNIGWFGNRSIDSVGTDNRTVIGGGRLIGTIDLKCINTGILAGDVISSIDGGAEPLNVAGEIIFSDGVEYGAFEVTRSSALVGRYYLQENAGVVLINQFRGANALANGELSGTLATNQRGTSALYTSPADGIGYYRADGINDYSDVGHTTLYDYGTIVPHDSENPTKALVWSNLGVQQNLQFVSDAKLSLEITEQPCYYRNSAPDEYTEFDNNVCKVSGSWSIVQDGVNNGLFGDGLYQTFFAKYLTGTVGYYVLYITPSFPGIRFIFQKDDGTTGVVVLPTGTIDYFNTLTKYRVVVDYNSTTDLFRIRIGNRYSDANITDLSVTSEVPFFLNTFAKNQISPLIYGIPRGSLLRFATLNRSLTDSEFFDDDFVWDKSDEDFNLEFSGSKYECYDTVGGGVYPYLGTLTPSNISRCKSLKSTMYQNGFNIYDDGAIAPKANSGADITRAGQTIVTSVAPSTGLNKLLDSIYKYSLPKSKKLWQSVSSFFTNGEPNLYTGAELEAQVGLESKATIEVNNNELSNLKILE